MPFPKWLARVNRRFTNRLLIRLSRRPPFAALTHTGRTSGNEYRIPINAFPTPTGFMFACTYGPDTDWVRNMLASNGATLEYDGVTIELTDPRLVDAVDARPFIPWLERLFLGVLRVKDFLAADRKDPEAA